MGNEKETEVGSKQYTDLLNRIKNQFLVYAISTFRFLYFFNCKNFKFTSLLSSPAAYFLSVVSGVWVSCSSSKGSKQGKTC